MSVILITLFISLPVVAIACGLSLDFDNEGWKYGSDSAEKSFINYDNGIEKLIISRTFETSPKGSVWVIPIPSNPNLIKVDVLTDIPTYYGYNVSEKAKDNIENIKNALLATQLYTLSSIVELLMPSYLVGGSLTTGGNLADFEGVSRDVTVYDHLEKSGMVVEILSAKNSDALYNYLKEKGLTVERDSIEILQDYIGNDFSLVASWVRSTAPRKSAKGVLMTFPTDYIYYPLKPGSVYSGDGLPEAITVLGHVTPKLYDDIKNDTYVNYFYSKGGKSTEGFFSTDKGFSYTEIVIDTKPSNLTEDLRIRTSTPIKIKNAMILNTSTFVYGLLLLLLISSIATLIVSRMLKLKLQNSTLLALSIANSLTLLGTIIGARLFLKEKRFVFVVLFSITFVLTTLVICFGLLRLYT